MKLFNKENKNKETRSLPMSKKGKSALHRLLGPGAYAVLLHHHGLCRQRPLTVINNLSDFIFGLIRAIGMILLGFGVVQIGLSLKSHDPSQRANGFLTLAGGVVITGLCQGDFDPDYRLMKKRRHGGRSMVACPCFCRKGGL